MYLFLKVHMYLCISNCSCICFSICSCICISIYSCIRISRCFSVSFRTFNLMYNKLFKQIVEQQNVFSFFLFFLASLASRAGDKFLFTEFEPKCDFYKMCGAQNPKTAATTTTTPVTTTLAATQQRQLPLRSKQ